MNTNDLKECQHDYEDDYAIQNFSGEITGTGSQCKLCGELKIEWDGKNNG